MLAFKYAGKLLAIVLLLIGGSLLANAQCPAVMPAGTACLTQSEMNTAGANARTVIAQDKEIAVLKDQLTEKDKSIAQLKKANDENTADLKNQLNKVTVDYATAQGQLIGCQASETRLSAVIDFMLKNGRTKQNGLINIKF